MYNKFKFLIVSIMLFSAFFFSCSKSTDAGIDLVPDDYLIHTTEVDTFNVIAHTIRVDTLITSTSSLALLGNYTHPIFGDYKASFVMEIIPTVAMKKYNFGKFPQIDSVILYFRYDTVYGNKSKQQEISISKITQRLTDTVYYYDFDASTLNPEFITSTTFIPEDDFVVDTLKEDGNDSVLVVKFPNEFAQKFVKDSTLWKDTTFSRYFQGFLIKSNTSSDNIFSIPSFRLFDADTRLSFYYHNTSDTLDHELRFNVNSSTCKHFNLFDQQYNSPNFLPDLENPEAKEDSVVYLQGGGGLKVKVEFPYLDQLKDKGLYGVNKAEIVLTANPSTLSQQSLYHEPQIIVIYAIDDNGNPSLLGEFLGSTGYYGVKYSNNKYVFDITYIAQQIVTGKQKNNGFYVMVKDASTNPSGIVLTGGKGKHSSPMKLVLTLTEIPQ